MLEDTPQVFVYMAIVAVVLLAAIAIPTLWTKWPHIPWSSLSACGLWACLGGWFGGPMTLNWLNHAPNATSHAVELRVVEHLRQGVRLQVVAGPFAGRTFRCSVSSWRAVTKNASRNASGTVREGRRGLLWANLE